MAKPILFSLNGAESTFGMNKVDRSRLYGYKELEVLDDGGEVCELATLADDGRTLVGKGGTGIGFMTADGNWCDKESLRPVDLEGETITPVKSSFGAAIELTERATFDEFLDHSIRLVYQLDLPEHADQNPIVKEVIAGTIFQFSYSYRGGLEADAGFLLANESKQIFMLVGDETSIRFIGLQPSTVAEVDVSVDDGDLMDFGMI